MKDLRALFDEVLDECMALDIPFGKIYNIVPNSRAKRRWGQCKKVPGGFEININVQLLDDDIDDMSTKTTIAHEVLHTCDGCLNHGDLWNKYANMLNRAYGYNIKRVSSADEKGVDQSVRNMNYKYIIRCKKCGSTSKYMKKSRIVGLIMGGSTNCCCGRCKNNTFTLEVL